MVKNQPQGRSAKSYARVHTQRCFQESAGLPIGFDRIRWKPFLSASLATSGEAYRLASIGLDGNWRHRKAPEIRGGGLPIGFDRIRWKPMIPKVPKALRILAYRLASIGLDGNSSSRSCRWLCSWAYRLASIGLDGNLNDELEMWEKIFEGLPIGFDRIRWKLEDILREAGVAGRAYRLASIGLDGNSPLPHQNPHHKRAYRLASIGLVGNRFRQAPHFLLVQTSLPIGFDRISWKQSHQHHLERWKKRCLPIGFDRISWKPLRDL